MQTHEHTGGNKPRRLPRALVITEPDAAQSAGIDWTDWYLTDEEDMGEGCEQGEIIRLLLSVLAELVRERGWDERYIGADQFFAWIEDEPLVRVSPDIYLLKEAPPPPRPSSWQMWKPGHHPPLLALEIVSDDWQKDYADNPPKYWQLGCQELVIFDPLAPATTNGTPRVALQLYRREADGSFVRRYAGPGPVHSHQLDAWLVVQQQGAVARLRLARDEAGCDLVPTEAEARKQAEARVAELEEQLRQLAKD